MKSPPFSKDLGLLVLRVGLGVMLLLHGLPKILGGPSGWESLAQFGLPMLPSGIIAMTFGLGAALAEFGGGLLLILGLWTRPACIALAGTMVVAFSTKLGSVEGWADFAKTAGWPLELLIVFVALFIAGPGKHRVAK